MNELNTPEAMAERISAENGYWVVGRWVIKYQGNFFVGDNAMADLVHFLKASTWERPTSQHSGPAEIF
jgi:hypothetical protein